MVFVIENLIVFFFSTPLGAAILISSLMYMDYAIIKSIKENKPIKDIIAKDTFETYKSRRIKKIVKSIGRLAPKTQTIYIKNQKPNRKDVHYII